jgi:uncharacterized membrane protein YkoI
MLDKKILISIVIVLVIGVAAASYQATTKTPGVWQSGVTESQLPTEQASSGSDGSSALTSTGSSGSVQSDSQSSTSSSQSGSSGTELITAAKAKLIAQQNIQDSQATAGTPVSTKIDGKQVYNVPIISDNNQVGYFIIDAQTGKIIEGAGGV